MKAVYAVVAGAAVAVAQNTTLAECGMTCINNMISKIQTSPYDCPSGNTACYCCWPQFGYGVRDCSNEYCGSGSSDATSAIVYAASYCASALPADQTTVCSSYTGGGVSATSGASAVSGASATTSAAAAVGSVYLLPIASGLSGYSVASTTITAGGSEATESGTAYSALSSNGGVVATASGVTTTYDLAALAALATAISSSSGASGSAAAAVGSAYLVPIDSGLSGYSVASTTITVGGSEATESGTAYSALSSNGGVVATASGVTTTYDLAALNSIASAATNVSGASSGTGLTSQATQSGTTAGGAGASSGATTVTTTNTQVSGAAATTTATTTSTTAAAGGAAMITAAPVLFGAAALAVLAL